MIRSEAALAAPRPARAGRAARPAGGGSRADHRRHRRPGDRRGRRRAARRHRRGHEPGAPGQPRRRSPTPTAPTASRLLPPGDYHVDLHPRGLRAPRRPTVAGEPRPRRHAQRRAARRRQTEEITVIGEAPVIDTTSTTLGTNLDAARDRDPAHRPQLLLGRAGHARRLLRRQPGEHRTSRRSPSTARSGAENVFYIDGVNTTGVEYGFQGKELNFEFIQAVDVKTGGYEAEFGRSTGGIINVITKSGGNEFHGDVFGYYDDDSLQASADDDRLDRRHGRRLHPRGLRPRPRRLLRQGQALVLRRLRPGDEHAPTATLPAGPRAGEIVDVDQRPRPRRRPSSPAASPTATRSIGTFFQDPRDDTGAINDAAAHAQRRAAHLPGRAQLRRRGLRAALRGHPRRQLGRSRRRSPATRRRTRSGPATAAGDVIQFRDVDDDFFQTGGFGLIQAEGVRARLLRAARSTRFLGGHELKVGLEYEEEKADVVKRVLGRPAGRRLREPDAGAPIYSHFYWTTPTATRRQRAGLAARRRARAQDHRRSTSRTAGRRAAT